MSELIILAFPSSYSRQGVVWCVATKEGFTMYDYMRALEDRFNSKPSQAQRQQLIAMRQEVSALLDKQGKKRLLRLVDAHTMAQEEMALTSFIAGFRLAWGIAAELSTDSNYSYDQEQAARFQEGADPDG